MKNKDKLSIVEIEFLDHCAHNEGTGDILPCKVIGWLVSEDKKQIVICTWLSEDEFENENSETLAIVKHPGIIIKYSGASALNGKPNKNTRAANRPHRSTRRSTAKARKKRASRSIR